MKTNSSYSLDYFLISMKRLKLTLITHILGELKSNESYNFTLTCVKISRIIFSYREGLKINSNISLTHQGVFSL